MPSDSTTFRALAAEVRKMAAEAERAKMLKCATVLIAATGLELLRKKVSHG